MPSHTAAIMRGSRSGSSSGASDVAELEERVKDEVTKAGFRVASEDSFLRNDKDPRDWNADSGVNKTHDQDRFAIKFVKP